MRKLTIAVVALVVGLLAAAFAFTRGVDLHAPELVRAESHRLQSAEGAKVTVVEFLDFECPACRAAYPTVEQIRKEYRGKITYVVRMFPLPAHANAEPAARAAEAAHNQGKFEAMYNKLFEGKQLQDFDAYAREIGLNMDHFHTDMASPSISDRIKRDKADGIAFKVQGTPTFFVNGVKVELSGLKAAIDKVFSDAAPAFRDGGK